MATSNGECLSDIPHLLNITELSWEELQDNLRLRYGLMPQDLLMTCNGYGDNLSIKNAQSCPMGGLVMDWNEDAEGKWGALGYWALTPSEISYEPKINSMTVKGESTGYRALQEG